MITGLEEPSTKWGFIPPCCVSMCDGVSPTGQGGVSLTLLHLHLLSSALRGVSSPGAFGACPARVAAHIGAQAPAPSVHQRTSIQTASVTPRSLSSCPGMKTTAHHHLHRIPSPLLLDTPSQFAPFSVFGKDVLSAVIC